MSEKAKGKVGMKRPFDAPSKPGRMPRPSRRQVIARTEAVSSPFHKAIARIRTADRSIADKKSSMIRPDVCRRAGWLKRTTAILAAEPAVSDCSNTDVGRAVHLPSGWQGIRSGRAARSWIASGQVAGHRRGAAFALLDRVFGHDDGLPSAVIRRTSLSSSPRRTPVWTLPSLGGQDDRLEPLGDLLVGVDDRLEK